MLSLENHEPIPDLQSTTIPKSVQYVLNPIPQPLPIIDATIYIILDDGRVLILAMKFLLNEMC